MKSRQRIEVQSPKCDGPDSYRGAQPDLERLPAETEVQAGIEVQKPEV